MQQKKQKLFQEIEDYINRCVDVNGVPPTVRDIAVGVGMSTTNTWWYLSSMEELGIISYDKHRKVITRQMENDIMNTTRTPLLTRAPVAGTIGCGEPRYAEEYIEETVKLPTSIFGEGPLFLLHAKGVSMVEAGIDEGDMVVVKHQNTAKSGQIVVALVEGETTLKRYYPEPDKQRIRLQPANSSMKPMYFNDVTIQGVVVKIIKDAIFM